MAVGRGVEYYSTRLKMTITIEKKNKTNKNSNTRTIKTDNYKQSPCNFVCVVFFLYG